ncbi:beta strand repeat-containing protein [Halobacterium hubeiense]|uniref:beta strand repeat-containing protein n=1 Tax=Halobacterium hubeiense TaxID=1407499 RepID=UPI000B7CA4B5|nr:PKD domain-containing protein [Halobacterium hubeiense]
MADSGGSSASARRSAVAVLAAALVVAAAGVGGAVGAVSGSTTTQAADSNPVEFVYVDDSTSEITFMRADGTTVGTGVSDAAIVGPMADLDDDGLLEASYVTTGAGVKAVDANGETQMLVEDGDASTGKVGVGDWTGDGVPEVVYADANNQLRYVNVSGSPTAVGGEEAKTVLGVTDFDGSGTTDVVFVGTSQNLHYYNGSTTNDTEYGNFANSDAAGAPADIYGDGELWVPVIDGSQYPEIVNSTGTDREFRETSNNTDKQPVAAVDWVGDDTHEIIHSQNAELAYTRADGTTRKVTDADGATVSIDESAGVARVVSRPADLSVSEFAATATGDQNVTVNVTTNHDLSELNVTLDGPETAALTLAAGDFEETGTDPYSYTATYDGSADGEYTATLDSAASAGDATSGNTDTATVDDRVPTVESVNLTDATNGDGDVEAGDEVTVNATVSGDVDSVTADLSAFDAGTVTLTGDGTGSYEANATVGPDATDGDQNVTVTASDGEGNTDSGTTGALRVDTENLSVALNDTRTVEEGQSVEFSPASVSGATGDVTYDWTFGDGNSSSGETVTHTYSASGTYTVEVTATDETGDTASDTTNVTVENPPVVESVNLTDATDGNGTVSPRDEVTVNATVSGSVDSVTADLSAFDAGSVELVADGGTYTNTTTVGANVTEGAQSATVTATGASGTEDSATTGTLDVVVDELTVTVGDDRTVGVNETVEYDASVAGATGDVTYDWTFGDGESATGKTVTHAYADTGTYTVEVTATDDAGTASDVTNVTVEDAPVVESAALTDATNGNGIVASGDNVTVSATVSGDVASVETDLSAFDAGNVTLTSDGTGDYAANVTVGSNATDGDQNATVVATGNQGNTDTGETGALTVDTENLSVSLNDTKTVEEGESAKFSPASVSDATGSVDYDWTFDDGGSASGETVTHAFEDDGTYEVILTADDGSDDVDTASMSVAVTANETTIEGTTTTDSSTTTDPSTTTSEPTSGDGGDGGTNDPAGSSDDETDPVATATATATPTTGGSAGTTTARPTESTTATATTAPTSERTPTATATAAETATATTAEPGAENVPPQSPGEAPGFGTAAALLALLAAAALALRE